MMYLANELLQLVFGFLSFDDLMVIKEVCLRFELLVQDMIRLRVVAVQDVRDEFPIVCKPFGQEEPIRRGRLLISRSMIFFKINTKIHSRLTRLIIYNPRKLTNLGGFDNLIELDIQLVTNMPPMKLTKLIFKLNALRRFAYSDKTSSNLRFILDTPKLTYMSLNISTSYFKIMRPETIEELHCLSNMSIEVFVNVKTVHCRHLYYDKERSLKPLRSLQRFFFYVLDNLNIISLSDFFNTSENGNLAIYYRSIHFDANPLRSDVLLGLPLTHLKDRDLQVYQEHLNHLGENLTQNELEVSHLDDRSPEIIRRLTNLTVLSVTSQVRNKANWIAILRSPMLTALHLKCHIDQDLLDLIPMHCQNLIKLELSTFENLSFILQLNGLTKFLTNKFFDFHLLPIIMDNLHKLRSIRVNFYVIEITNDRIRCKLDGIASLYIMDEPRQTFMQMINSVDDWTTLFRLDEDM